MEAMELGEHDVVLNGIRLHYEIRGRGPVLLAHSGGPGFDARGWDAFAGIEDFLTLVILHPRGSGLSAAPRDGSYALEDYTADLEALRMHLQLERPALIGWSHGGMVALKYAIEYPGRLSRLILYDTAAYFGDFLDDIDSAVQAFRDEPWFESSYQALKAEWAGDYETDEDMAALWADEMKFYFHEFGDEARAYHQRTRNLPVRVAPLKAFNDHEAETMDLRPGLASIKIPTLVIVGEDDFITDVKMAEEMVRYLPDARLQVFERAGHFVHVERPRAFAEAVRTFFEVD